MAQTESPQSVVQSAAVSSSVHTGGSRQRFDRQTCIPCRESKVPCDVNTAGKDQVYERSGVSENGISTLKLVRRSDGHPIPVQTLPNGQKRGPTRKRRLSTEETMAARRRGKRQHSLSSDEGDTSELVENNHRAEDISKADDEGSHADSVSQKSSGDCIKAAACAPSSPSDGGHTFTSPKARAIEEAEVPTESTRHDTNAQSGRTEDDRKGPSDQHTNADAKRPVDSSSDPATDVPMSNVGQGAISGEMYTNSTVGPAVRADSLTAAAAHHSTTTSTLAGKHSFALDITPAAGSFKPDKGKTQLYVRRIGIADLFSTAKSQLYDEWKAQTARGRVVPSEIVDLSET